MWYYPLELNYSKRQTSDGRCSEAKRTRGKLKQLVSVQYVDYHDGMTSSLCLVKFGSGTFELYGDGLISCAFWSMAHRFIGPAISRQRQHVQDELPVNSQTAKLSLTVWFLSASLYFSKKGAYWDRLCRDVVGRWLVGWLSRACTVAKRCILGL